MIGSRLLGQQPTFSGDDFGIPEVALFGYYQFRSAVATSDDWEQHDGIEILFLQSGEACWDLAGDQLSMATGSQAVVIPAGRLHRILNGVYTPCRLLWMVFHRQDLAKRHARLFLDSEIDGLFEMAKRQERPVRLPESCHRAIVDLSNRLNDERLLIGSTQMMAEVRANLYLSVTSLWDVCTNARNAGQRSKLVRHAERLLQLGIDESDDDGEARIEDVARRLGYGKSHLYNLFSREVGMTPNDYRQRIRIKRCCKELSQTDDTITSIGIGNGFHSSQYFARVFKKYVGVTPREYRGMFSTRHMAAQRGG
jgi:AraC-like DNA-binding protein